jgi:hypothetical protein
MDQRGCELWATRPAERRMNPGIPRTVPSGDRLRNWLGLTPRQQVHAFDVKLSKERDKVLERPTQAIKPRPRDVLDALKF